MLSGGTNAADGATHYAAYDAHRGSWGDLARQFFSGKSDVRHSANVLIDTTGEMLAKV